MPASIDIEHIRNILYSWPEIAMILLYNNFYDKLIRIADIHTRDRQASEDVLQEVFADVWRRHKEIGQKKDESIQRYLIKAVQYHSITHYKKRVKTSEQETQYFYANETNPPEYSVEASIIADESRRFLRLIVGTLPPREKECFLMQIDGMRVKEIARRLGITVKAVERSLTSARKRLRGFSGVVL